ncbi:histidine kinase [Flavobacterium zepuense]|uniref:histidine kinase n=2 Tax=Flavobacterium zepuense TaxID=2593302 RepID=A0A552V322_9FLAO|nr:histidine kinase [Flavobacterium zepuense]
MLPMFNATLFLPQYGEKWYKRNIDSGFNQTIVTGLFLMLSILHLFLYLSHRKKSINLLFSIYAFTMAIAQFRGVFGATKPLMTEQFISSFLFNISAPFAGMVFLYAIYTYFGQRKKALFYILLVCCVLSSVHQFISGDPMKQLSTNLAVVLTLIEAARIGYIGMKKGIQGGTLFFAGQIASVITFLLLPVASIYSPWSFFYLFSYDVAFLIPPLLVSFILARDFGSTNKLLTQQLKDIEGLSAINLAQEQEKRLLLANQNTLLEQQVAARTAELQSSLEDLKQTQAQLIQSEKMASLGELTAGIAHEIQNPLNFVNNFSDVSIELLEEMGEELDKGDTEEVKAITADLKLNLEKIAHHGRRADSIVKGMLLHSRTSTGQKEPIDVNALADEYLRLAYHGLRAKDKSFNADLVTNFGESLPKVNAISQDLGRVLLNLFTNAFYATQQKSKQFTDGSYKPVVEVNTLQQDNSVQIIVRDNGTGIPDAIKDKILQPFFTTKPTGEGTGLGLSLSYDIVVKVHNGTINIESTEGEGCTFFINIPL